MMLTPEEVIAKAILDHWWGEPTSAQPTARDIEPARAILAALDAAGYRIVEKSFVAAAAEALDIVEDKYGVR